MVTVPEADPGSDSIITSYLGALRALTPRVRANDQRSSRRGPSFVADALPLAQLDLANPVASIPASSGEPS